jgi:hypothetical protein
MATSKNEIIYDLWNFVTPLISDDSVLDERALSYWIDIQRALWIKNDQNKPHSTDDNIVQSLGAVEFEVVDRIEGSPYTGGKSKIIKSKLQIPVAIELHNGTLITRVGSLDMTTRPYKLIDYTAVPYTNNGKFNKNELYAFLKGGYLYVISDCNNPAWKVLKYLNIRGVWEKPEEASRFNNLDGTSCYTSDSNYPINKWMLAYLKSEIIKADLKPFIQPILDESNNANPLNEQINTNT